MPQAFKIRLLPELPVGHGVVEDKAGAADQVAAVGVIHRAIILEIMVKTSARINAARIIELSRMVNMIEQSRGCKEVRLHKRF